MGSFFTLYLTSAAAFFSIDSENEHENTQGVIGVYNIYGIGIRPVKQLLRYRCYRLAVRTFDGVIPGQKIAVDLPAVKVYIKLLLEQSKALCYAADVFILAEIYLELRSKNVRTRSRTVPMCFPSRSRTCRTCPQPSFPSTVKTVFPDSS